MIGSGMALNRPGTSGSDCTGGLNGVFDVSDDEGVFSVGWDEFDRRTTVNGGVTFGSGMAADEEDISTALWTSCRPLYRSQTHIIERTPGTIAAYLMTTS